MCAYLKNMGGYKYNQLKGRSYEEIQKLFDKAYKQVNSFVPMDSEVVKSNVTITAGSSKRAGDELESDKSKKQKINKHVEAKKDDDQEEEEMKMHIEIVKYDELMEVQKDTYQWLRCFRILIEKTWRPSGSWLKLNMGIQGQRRIKKECYGKLEIQKKNIKFRGGLLGLKDFKMILKVTAAQLQLLRDYDLWSMRMEQYLTHTDYSLWEVIDGDAPSIVSASAGTEGLIPPKTAEQKLARKNELKAKSTLPVWTATKESKKMQKTILKQQYENFDASRSEGLDKTYDRFQKLISQLEIHGEVISQEDANLKLLRSLPSAWNNIALIMKNKSDLDTLSMDDLYNNLKVYEYEIKGQSSSSLNSQNVAFVSLENTSSTNEVVNTAHDVSTASS
ncbi:hypothetical protein Tco_0357059 [Tanacetum coccineum]